MALITGTKWFIIMYIMSEKRVKIKEIAITQAP